MEFFNIGIWELITIFIVALLVFGPDRLPDMARQAARMWGELRRAVAEVNAELQRGLEQVQEPIREGKADLQRGIDQFNAPLQESKEILASVAPIIKPPTGAVIHQQAKDEAPPSAVTLAKDASPPSLAAPSSAETSTTEGAARDASTPTPAALDDAAPSDQPQHTSEPTRVAGEGLTQPAPVPAPPSDTRPPLPATPLPPGISRNNASPENGRMTREEQ